MNLKKLQIFSALFGICMFIIPTAVFSTSIGPVEQSQAVQLEVTEGLLTVAVKDVSLPVLLEKLADQTGLGFEIYADINSKISARFKNVPLDEGIKRLLDSCNYFIIYSNKNKESIAGSVQIIKIVVFDKSGRSSSKPIIAQDQRLPHSSQPEQLSSSKQFSRASLPRLTNKKAGSGIPDNLTITHALTSLQDYARLLKDSDPIVREDALLQLAAEYNEEAISYLEDVLVRDGNSAVRSAAAEEIAFIGGDAGIEALVKGLNDTDDEIRETVVTALGEIGGKSVLPALTMAMTDSLLLYGKESMRLQVQWLAKQKVTLPEKMQL